MVGSNAKLQGWSTASPTERPDCAESQECFEIQLNQDEPRDRASEEEEAVLEHITAGFYQYILIFLFLDPETKSSGCLRSTSSPFAERLTFTR